MINVLKPYDFKEFIGNSAAFDFFCEYSKFDLNRFEVSWLYYLYPHSLEEIAKNKTVKENIRNAIAKEIIENNRSNNDIQKLQDILVKHFC